MCDSYLSYLFHFFPVFGDPANMIIFVCISIYLSPSLLFFHPASHPALTLRVPLHLSLKGDYIAVHNYIIAPNVVAIIFFQKILIQYNTCCAEYTPLTCTLYIATTIDCDVSVYSMSSYNC